MSISELSKELFGNKKPAEPESSITELSDALFGSDKKSTYGDRTSASVDLAVKKKPEEFRKQRDIAKEIGTDRGFVERNQSDAETIAAKRKIDLVRLKESAPNTYEWLGNPDNAAASWDDIDRLAKIEEFKRSKDGNLGDLVVAGGKDMLAAIELQRMKVKTDRMQELEDDISGLKSGTHRGIGARTSAISGQAVDFQNRPLVKFSGAPIGSSREAIFASIDDMRGQQMTLDQSRRKGTESFKQLIEGSGKVKFSPSVESAMQAQGFTEAIDFISEHPLDFILETAARSAAPSVMSMAGGLAGAVAGPAGFAVGIGTGSAAVDFVSEFRGNLAEHKVDVNDTSSVLAALENKTIMDDIAKKSAIHASFVGAIDGLTAGVASKFIGSGGAIGTLAGELVNVSAQIGIQAGGGILGEQLGSWAAGKDVGWGELFAEGGASVLSVPFDVAMARNVAGDRKANIEAETMHNTSVQHGKATASKQWLDNQVLAAKESSLRTSDPEVFQDFIKNVVGEDDSISIAAEDAATFFQEHPEVADQISESDPELMQSIDTSIKVGSPTTVPMSKYLTSMVDHHEAISDLVRINENEMNYSEAIKAADEFSTNLADKAAAIEAKEKDPFKESADKVYENIRSQILASGRFSDDVAKKDAELHRAFSIVRAKQLGIMPDEFYKKYALGIAGGGSKGKPLGKPGSVDYSDDLIYRMRSGRTPTDSEIYGETLLEHLSDKGGLKDSGGELASRDIDKNSKTFKKKLIQKGGLDLDEAARIAHQEGYIEERDINLLLEAIDNEMSGFPAYAPQNTDQSLFEIRSGIDSIERDLQTRGITDISGMSNAELSNSITPDYVPTFLGEDAFMQQAKADGYEGASIGEAEEWTRAKAKGLDMSKEARMQRAKDMGFDTDQVWYHGSTVSGLDTIEPGYSEPGAWFTKSLQYANDYAKSDEGEIYSVLLKPDKTMSVDFDYIDGEISPLIDGEPLDIDNNVDIIKYAERKGYDSVHFPEGNFSEESNAFVVLSSSQIRSVNAAFDPDYEDSSNLLAQSAWHGSPHKFDKFTTDAIDSEMMSIPVDKNRGQIEFGDIQATITLLENADLSTFLHETGHFFLETTAQIAASPNAPQAIKDDMNLMLDFIGEDNVEAWLAKSINARRAGHEKIAEAFEKYLMEGKAPSTELMEAFSRFRSWLLDVYSRLTASNVKLTDEVRGVFDRMLATQDQIDAAKERQGIVQVFDTAEEAGMTDAAFAKYQESFVEHENEAIAEHQSKSINDMKYLDNAIGKAMMAAQREAAQARRAMRAEVSEEINRKPVFLAREFLTKGTVLGELPNGLEPMKLGRNDLAEVLDDKEAWKAMPRGSTVAKNGTHPDVIAPIFDYNTGEEMARDIIAAGHPNDAIADLVDKRMLERYGDMYSPEQMRTAAMDAVQGKARVKILSTELNALNKRAGRASVPYAAIKSYAQHIISGLKVSEAIKSNQYLISERTAAKLSMEAMKKGESGTAAIQKRNQLVQQSMYRESRDASKDVAKMLRYLKRFDKKSIRQKMTAEYLDQIDAILNRYSLKNVPAKQLEKTKSISEWMDSEQEKNGVRPDIPEYIKRNIELTSYKELSLEQFEGLYTSVKEIEGFGRFKKRLLENKKKRDLYEAIDNIVDSLTSNNSMGHEERPLSPSLKEKVADKSTAAAAALFNVEAMFRMLDGDKLGSLHENIFAPLSEASDRVFTRNAGVAKRLRETIVSSYSKAELLRFSGVGAKRYNINGIKGGLTRENIVVIALHYGNEGGRDRLSNDFTDSQIEQALSNLTDADASLIEFMWNEFDSNLWPDLAALEREFHAEAPAKVVATPFVINGKEMKGGYMPLKYDPSRGNAEKIIDERISLADFATGMAGKTTTKQGHAKERKSHVGASLRLDLGVFAEGVTDSIQDIEMRKPVVDAYKIITNKVFSENFTSAAGVNAYELLEPWLRDIAVPAEGPRGGINRIIARFRKNTAIVAMGLSVKTAALNITGYLQAFDANDVGASRIAKEAAKFFANPADMKKTQDWVFEKSEYMSSIANTFDRDARKSMNTAMGVKGALTPAWFSWFYLIVLTNKAVAIPTWKAAYDRAMKDHANDEKRAIQFADHIIRATQGGGRNIDLSAMQRGLKDNRELYKAFTMFYSYFQSTLMRNVRNVRLLKENGITDIPRFIASLMFLNVLPAVISAFLAGYGPGDDEDEAAWAASETLKFMFGQVPFVRDFAGVAIDKISGQYAFPYRVTPIAGAVEQAVMGPMKIIADFSKDEVDERTLKEALLTSGVYFGLPSRQVWRTSQHLIHVESGESDFSMIDLLMGEQFKK
jgi:hypothetical protein